MIALVIIVLAALWMLTIGSMFKVTSGGFFATFLYKVLPVVLSVGLALVAVGNFTITLEVV